MSGYIWPVYLVAYKHIINEPSISKLLGFSTCIAHAIGTYPSFDRDGCPFLCRPLLGRRGHVGGSYNVGFFLTAYLCQEFKASSMCFYNTRIFWLLFIREPHLNKIWLLAHCTLMPIVSFNVACSSRQSDF